MEILRNDAALLSNFEVLALLNDQRAQRQANEVHGAREVAENLRTIEFEVQRYLNNSPCATQDPEQIKNLKQAFAGYGLMKVEVLQILNLRPRTPVELVLIIEEFEERFSVEDCEKMLELITTALPRDDDEVMEEAEEVEQ
ncbi:hypothetical protein DFQ27_007550 [Actinomortierella ambigua]|uniref:DNA-directed RNA polymerase III subunit RPC9 n=1 Tax=Actinomortierella ambigua TaxID=1343610 RepID=A0A9P6UD78_9FUNG|nr:hypothetical protein DFQ26_000184 [Actinomortierella ambigua]KAG0270398.1 hypothetical protein DFQ27_007550 [Actinomortierella ambigua]